MAELWVFVCLFNIMCGFFYKYKDYRSDKNAAQRLSSSKVKSNKYGFVLYCLFTHTLSFPTTHVTSNIGHISLPL